MKIGVTRDVFGPAGITAVQYESLNNAYEKSDSKTREPYDAQAIDPLSSTLRRRRTSSLTYNSHGSSSRGSR